MCEQQKLWYHNQGVGPTPARPSTQGEVQARTEGELISAVLSHPPRIHPCPLTVKQVFVILMVVCPLVAKVDCFTFLAIAVTDDNDKQCLTLLLLLLL